MYLSAIITYENFLQPCTSFVLDEKSPKIILGCANRLSRINFSASMLELSKRRSTKLFLGFANESIAEKNLKIHKLFFNVVCDITILRNQILTYF